MNKKTTICFITFGGSPNETDKKYANIEMARDRIILQAENSHQFDKYIGLDWIQLSELCGKFDIQIPAKPNRYIFTPILLKLISLKAFGAFDFFLYAGSGCEINSNYFARRDLKQMITFAKRNTLYVEHTLLPEKNYTKKEALIDFNVPKKAQNSPQICATFFLVSCNSKKNKLFKISSEWLEYSIRRNGFYISDEFDPQLQIASFENHRNDQSLFSIVLKKNGIKSKIEKQRNFDKYLPSLRGSTIFLWTNRNRSGVSMLPNNTERFVMGLFAFIFSPIFYVHHWIISYTRLFKNHK